MHERNVFFPFLLPVRFSVRCEATPTLFRESLRINFSFPPRECYRTKTFLDDSRFVSKVSPRFLSITLSSTFPLYVSFSLCLSFERIPESWNNAKVGLARLDSGEARNFHHLARTCSSSPFFDSRSSVPSPLGRKFNPAAFNPRNFLISDIYTRLFVDMERFESLHVSREQSATGYPIFRKKGIEEFIS